MKNIPTNIRLVVLVRILCFLNLHKIFYLTFTLPLLLYPLLYLHKNLSNLNFLCVLTYNKTNLHVDDSISDEGRHREKHPDEHPTGGFGEDFVLLEEGVHNQVEEGDEHEDEEGVDGGGELGGDAVAADRVLESLGLWGNGEIII